MATVERRRIDLGRKGKASVDIPVDSTAGSLLVSVSKTGDCAPSSQQLRLVRPNGLPLAATGVGVQIAEHAMGKMFLVDAPEPGLWKLEAEGSGSTELVAQARSELEFHRFEFVRPGGDIHGGFSKIPGSPVLGAKALGAATLFGAIGSVRFSLVDDAGRTLGRPTLATNYAQLRPERELPLSGDERRRLDAWPATHVGDARAQPVRRSAGAAEAADRCASRR